MVNLLGDDMFGLEFEEKSVKNDPPLQPRLTWLIFEEVAVPEYAIHYLTKDTDGYAVVHLTTGQQLKTGNTFEYAAEALE